jgi:hypothetical protein
MKRCSNVVPSAARSAGSRDFIANPKSEIVHSPHG